jgi:aspartate carbamoyltransferase catalytic subunit
MTPDFAGRDLVRTGDLSVEEITHVLDVAQRMEKAADGEEVLEDASGQILATLFFEPSTRTRLSFQAAVNRLGGDHIGFDDPEAASVQKGETLADTVRVVSEYADALVLRHPYEGAGRLASEYASVPLVNGGDGAGQHPTQTLVDLYTLREKHGRIEGTDVAIFGDLRYGRTVHSLAPALARFGADIHFVAPEELRMPDERLAELDELGGSYTETDDIEDVIGDVDAIYATRIQEERFPDPDEYRRVKGSYRLDEDLLSKAKKSMVVLHPLPRREEIHASVDETPHAAYFDQAAAGVPVRMALLGLLLGVIE